MKVLVVGGGGREHALAWKICRSPMVDKVYCAPGNAGIAQIAECVDISLVEGFEPLVDFTWKEKIDLTVVGPEESIVKGLVDAFQGRGLRVFGPSKAAAEIEGSKAWAKQLMWQEGIPTAEGRIFMQPRLAKKYVEEKGAPIVVKASGLAGGKGTRVCQTKDEALQAIQDIMVKKIFGVAGDTVVIEEFLEGEEITFTVLTDGKNILPLATSQDHKRVLNGDKGLNTGGMGAYSPVPIVTPALHNQIIEEIVGPVIKGMRMRGRVYKGALYVGLMITEKGPKVLEFNCRLGDPETQVILPRLKSDLIPALQACVNGTLGQIELEWKTEPAVCVVMASGGYPEKYEKGKLIGGLDQLAFMRDVLVFHAGTAIDKDGNFITNGGRVLGITAFGESMSDAIARTYAAVGKIYFDQVHFRKDIGYRHCRR